MYKIYNFGKEALSRRWIPTALFATFIFWGFGYETVWSRLSLQLSGTIVSRQFFPDEGAPRHTTHYVILANNGIKQIYEAGPTDASLRRNLPVGAHVDKRWGELDYRVNDQLVRFPKTFYCIVLLVGGAVAIYSLKLWSRQRN